MLDKREARERRKLRIFAKITRAGLPRLSIYRSNRALSVAIIDDKTRKTLVSARMAAKNQQAAIELGRRIAKAAIAQKIIKVVFDRSGYRYHGKIKALADSIREGGLKF